MVLRVCLLQLPTMRTFPVSCLLPLQSEWNALQLAQLRMTHQQEKEKAQRKAKVDAPAAAPAEKSKGRVVKPVSRSGRIPDHADSAHRAEWDEV